MFLVDHLKGEIVSGERALSAVAAEVRNATANKRTIGRIEDELRAAEADGVVDATESTRLRALVAEAGLDTRAIDAAARSGAPIAPALRATLDAARDRASGDDLLLNLRIQEAEHRVSFAMEVATNVQKSGHDANMAVIRNI